MNKRCFLILFICTFIFSVSFAAPSVYQRTPEDLRISGDKNVTDYNKDIILGTPKVDETEKVYDFADLFTENEEEVLYDEITEFISESNLDMAVVTIDDNPKNSAMNYADDFYDYNYFGTGTTHDGLLFLIDMDTREIYISTTGTAQVMYDDTRIDNILDVAYLRITNQDYYGCASKFIERSGYYFNLGVPSSNKYAGISEDGDYVDERYVLEDNVLWSVFFRLAGLSVLPAFIIALIIVFIMKSKHKTVKKATSAWAYMHSPAITYRDDSFFTTNTIRVYDPPSSSSSGGGSSTHRSSSGRSHGGGGRRF